MKNSILLIQMKNSIFLEKINVVIQSSSIFHLQRHQQYRLRYNHMKNNIDNITMAIPVWMNGLNYKI